MRRALARTCLAAGTIGAILVVSVGPALSADTTNSLTDSKKLSPQPPLVNEQLIEPSQADMQMAKNVITAIAHDMGAPRSDVDLALEALGLIPDAS